MDEQTLVALRSSIDIKWKGIRYRGRKDKGSKDCDLCLLFVTEDSENAEDCCRCPVSNRVENDGCENTPYVLWTEHQYTVHPGLPRILHPGCKECESICDKQIAFLESLLPNNRKEV